MKRYRRGLVVGKFCPLHRGHMHLIDAALAACGEVLVISYTKPDFARCATATREGWLADLYPQALCLVVDDAVLADAFKRGAIDRRVTLPHNDAPADAHRRFCAWLCLTLGGGAVDAVFTSEAYGDGFAAVLAAEFSAHLGVAHWVDHVCVDLARRAVPVSGTQVRADPAAWRAYLDPSVYADVVDRVCILGGESSGKTTLVDALAAALGATAVPEVGRTRWEEKGGRFVYEDMRAIAEDQVALEIALAQDARGPLVCDGSALTTVFYSEDGYGKVDPAAPVGLREHGIIHHQAFTLREQRGQPTVACGGVAAREIGLCITDDQHRIAVLHSAPDQMHVPAVQRAEFADHQAAPVRLHASASTRSSPTCLRARRRQACHATIAFTQ